MACLVYKRIRGKCQLAELHALQRACLPNDIPAHKVKGSAWWGVYDSGRMIAFGGIEKGVTPGIYYLCRAGVLPEYRGQGIQKSLIHLRIAWAVKRGAASVVTDTAAFSVASMRNLMACGFMPYVPEEPWALDCSVYWQRKL